MYTIQEVKNIIDNCKNEDQLLAALLILHRYKKNYSLIELQKIDKMARLKIQVLNN